MPATRLASTAIDRVSQTREPVAAEVAAYAGSDVICYLAENPTSLIERQQAEWGPWRDWAARELGVALHTAEGIVHRAQAPEALERVKTLALEMDDHALTGLATAVPLLGSAVLGLAVQRGALSGEAALDLSRLDEAFTEERWAWTRRPRCARPPIAPRRPCCSGGSRRCGTEPQPIEPLISASRSSAVIIRHLPSAGCSGGSDRRGCAAGP